MIFETPRLSVRHWGVEDLNDLHTLYGDPAMSESIGPSLNIMETKQIFDEQMLQYELQPHAGRYVIIEKETNSFIGTFLMRVMVEPGDVEIGYAIKKQDWGKGLATEVVNQGIEYIFQSTSYNTIFAFTEISNINSRKVLDKCGFQQQSNLFEDGGELNAYSLKKEIYKTANLQPS